MIAALSSNTHQTYQPFYDQLASGWGVPQESVLDGFLGEIPDCAFRVLSTYFDPNMLRSINLYEGRTPGGRAYTPSSDTIVFRRGEFANNGIFRQDAVNTIGFIALMAEEVEHIRQYREFGNDTFLALYGKDVLQVLATPYIGRMAVTELLDRGTVTLFRAGNRFEVAGEGAASNVFRDLTGRMAETGKHPCEGGFLPTGN